MNVRGRVIVGFKEKLVLISFIVTEAVRVHVRRIIRLLKYNFIRENERINQRIGYSGENITVGHNSAKDVDCILPYNKNSFINKKRLPHSYKATSFSNTIGELYNFKPNEKLNTRCFPWSFALLSVPEFILVNPYP